MKKIMTALALLMSLPLMALDSSEEYPLTGSRVISLMSSPGKNPQLAFDGDPSTIFTTNGDEMKWVGMELDTTYVITRIGFRPAGTSQGQDNMQLSIFEGANRPDFMDAIPLYLIPYKPDKSRMTYVDINVTRAFRYVRYVGSSGSNCRVADLEFYGYASEGSDERFYQISDIPTVSIHVENEANPWNKGEEFNAIITNIYDRGTLIQEYPITTHVRGNYSATHPNKPFRVKFDDGKKHHMMKDGINQSPTKAKKWVLINSYRDKTLMRNPVAWEVSKYVNPTFTPWSQPVDLILNGDYHGTYTLADHIDINKERINITEMEPGDIEGEAVTGGYYFEADNNYGSEPYHWLSAYGNTMSIHDPDEDVMQPQQFDYLRNHFNEFEERLFGTNYCDSAKGYQSRLDLESFLKHFLISEFNGNTDMICQVFLYKERGDDHIYTGPVWDHELALENDITYYPGREQTDWTYTKRQTGRWGDVVSRVLSDATATARLQEMWSELRDDSVITVGRLAAMVDSFRNEMSTSASLNFLRWPYLLQSLSLNPRVWGTWDAEVDNVRSYVSDRVAWMDKKLHYSSLDTLGSIYLIYSPRDLCQFSELVKGGKLAAKARLLADLDMTKYSDRFLPLGTTTKPFTGTIDGNGHTITNLHISGNDGVGLVANAGSECTIKNLTLGKGCLIEGNNYVAGFVGNLVKGTLTIESCGFEGMVNASGVYAAGFVGFVKNSLAYPKLNNCYNAGTITANNRAAAMIAPVESRLIANNSYNIGRITGVEADHEFASGVKQTTLTNSYDLYATSATQALPVVADSVNSGWLCVKLTGDKANAPWRQNLDNGQPHDDHPVLNASHGKVYYEDGIYTNMRELKEAYRYYYIDFTKVGSDVLQLAEIAFLNEEFNELDVKAYKGSNGFGSEGWENLSDKNVNTKYCGNGGLFQFFFDAGTSLNIYGYRLYTANDTRNYPERNPRSWRLYGSNTYSTDPDASSWVLIDEKIDDNTLEATSFEPYDFYLRRPKINLQLSAKTLKMDIYSTAQLICNIQPQMYAGTRLTWRSTDEQIATVTDDGTITAKGFGTARIIVAAPDYGINAADTCNLVVTEKGTGFQYYLLEIVKAQGDGTLQLSEFELLTDEGSWPTLQVYDYVAGFVGNHPVTDMVDGSVYTKYCGGKVGGTDAIRIYLDATEPLLPIGYRMYTANDNNRYPGRNPGTWRLWGSDKKASDARDSSWVLLDERTEDTTMKDVTYTPYDFYIDLVTPIEEVEDEDSNKLSESDVYDLSGRRMPQGKLRHGIYIIGKNKILK